METPMQKTEEIVVLVEDSGARQTLYKESVLLFPQPLQNQGCTAVSPPTIPLHDRGVTAFQSHLSVRLVAIFCEAKVASEFIWLGLVQHFISPISVPQEWSAAGEGGDMLWYQQLLSNPGGKLHFNQKMQQESWHPIIILKQSEIQWRWKVDTL